MTETAKPDPATAPPDLTGRAFQEFGGELQRFLTRRLRCAHTARDLAQDVYLRFMLVSRREGIRNTRAFLYQLATHVAHEYRLRQQHSQIVYDSDLMDAADRQAAVENGGDASDQLSAAEQLDRALRPLPKVYRTVLLLRKREGLSPDEIAQRLGFSKKTVYEYLTRALARVKEAQLDR